jgi:predicted transcriptional regulator
VLAKVIAKSTRYYRINLAHALTLKASQILKSDIGIRAVMVTDSFGGTEDLAFPVDSIQSEISSRLTILMRNLALQARSSMDYADLSRLRFVRTSFDQFDFFAFPLYGNRVLVLALNARNTFNSQHYDLTEFLQSLEGESLIEGEEIAKSILSEMTFSRVKTEYPPNFQEHHESQQEPIQGNDKRIAKRSRIVRSQNQIIVAILEACRTPSVQHWIMIKARLGYETFWTHMNRLLNEDMLRCFLLDKKTVYSVTEAGLSLLEKLRASEKVS